ncbi:hypothetical protein KSP35_13180 [Aquihabitans sp. G128]|uniref:hypothetical protein n=1 Tax=Aquihabitans sp. G128 TaxID=2849779 RepID=UPI001C24A735|nr:hypothetical protein [Aquihabitans sp. G128]QXC59356.1 hypothetical protein KSP35_13180 [Aquihabitans sp. G128]
MTDGFQPIVSPQVLEADVDRLNAFMGSDRPLASVDEALLLLCTLRSVVAHSGVTNFPSAPDDCVCGRGPAMGFQNQGESLRFVIAATERALRERTATTGPCESCGEVTELTELPTGPDWADPTRLCTTCANTDPANPGGTP